MVIRKDPKTGKYYIAPSPPSFYKSKPTAPTKSGSSRTSSSFIQKITSPTYNPITKIYTDSSGNKMSMSLDNAQKRGAIVTISPGTSRSRPRSRSVPSSKPEITPAQKRVLTKRLSTKPASILSIKRPGQIATRKTKDIGFRLSILKPKAIEFADILTGGSITESRINKKEEQLQKDISRFNEKYGDRDLTQEEYKTALSASGSIKTREKNIEEQKESLVKSFKTKIYNLWVNIDERRISKKDKKKEIERNKPRVKKLEKELKEIDIKLKKESGKKSILSKLNYKRLKNVKSSTQSEINRLKTGEFPRVYAGDLPIIPAMNIPKGVTLVKFIGKQRKAKGGKVLTDLVFKTNTGRMGVAKGVSISKGKQGASITLGRSGKKAISFPSGKAKVIDLQSFIGREKVLTSSQKIKVQKTIDLIASKKKAGTITLIEKNLKALRQVGIGQVGIGKGKKIIKGGKVVKGFKIDDFASLSAVFSKKDLSLIIGRSMTSMGAKSKFIGLIKGSSKAKKSYTLAEKQQFQKGLSKIISATASALAKEQAKTGTLPKATVLAIVSKTLLAQAKETKTIITPKLKPKVKLKTIPKTKTTTTTKPGTRTISKRKSLSKQKARQRAIQKTKQKPKQKAKQRAVQKTKPKAKQKSIQRARPKSMQKQKQLVKPIKKPGAKTIPRVPRIPKDPERRKKKKKKTIITRKGKKKGAYNVYARPLKKSKSKAKPKMLKVNKVPLSKPRAKDVRNYITDTSLSRTARIKKTRGKPKPSRLKVPRGYAKKTAKKFRKHKTVKGKRKALPKGTVIEKRKRLLDTRQEKNQITLRRRIKQITKPKKKSKKTKKKRR